MSVVVSVSLSLVRFLTCNYTNIVFAYVCVQFNLFSVKISSYIILPRFAKRVSTAVLLILLRAAFCLGLFVCLFVLLHHVPLIMLSIDISILECELKPTATEQMSTDHSGTFATLFVD